MLIKDRNNTKPTPRYSQAIDLRKCYNDICIVAKVEKLECGIHETTRVLLRS